MEWWHKKKYAKKLKREFEERVKELELEEEINNIFKRDMGKEKPSQITEKQVVEMISDFEVSDRKMMKILRKMKQIFGKKAVTPNI